jgi:drug/metabolite transporter (DMT)-like permease
MTRYRSELALLIAALLFGVTFPLVHDALADIDPFAYLALRFAIAVIVLGPFAIVPARRAGALERRLLIRVGIPAGVLLFGGYATQTVGLQTTSPSTSAFITGLYVVLTPIVESIVRRRRPPAPVLAGIALATVGLYLLTGADLSLVGTGELWTLAGAVIFAVWIVYQGEYAARLGPIPFTTVQMVMVAALAVPPMAAGGVGDITGLAVFAAAFTGIACSSVALSLQVYGQRRIAPSRAALILLLEPVFAAVAGFVNGERLGLVAVGGALVILLGILISELGPGRRVMPPPEILEPRPF